MLGCAQVSLTPGGDQGTICGTGNQVQGLHARPVPYLLHYLFGPIFIFQPLMAFILFYSILFSVWGQTGSAEGLYLTLSLHSSPRIPGLGTNQDSSVQSTLSLFSLFAGPGGHNLSEGGRGGKTARKQALLSICRVDGVHGRDSPPPPSSCIDKTPASTPGTPK